MSEFFAPAIQSETLKSDKLRIHMVSGGDGMAPSLRHGIDYVLLMPVSAFSVEGVYLVDGGHGEPTLYRVAKALDGKLCLTFDNPKFRDPAYVTRRAFDNGVLGLVVADIKIRNEHFLRGL